MGRLPAFLALAASAGLLSGCGSAPSTTLAPDKPMPDASKMSSEDVDRMLKSNHEDMKRP